MASSKHMVELAKLARTHRVSDSVTGSAIVNYLSALNCPRSLAVLILYESGEHEQLVNLTCNPTDYSGGLQFRDAYLATEFLSKSNFLKLDRKRDEVAFQKFFEFEEICKETNYRFRNPSFDPSYSGSNASLLHAMKRKIEKLLGDFSPDEFVDGAGWGPGVTTLIKGENVSAINKFHSENGITRDLYSLVSEWFPLAYPIWYEVLVQEHGLTPFTFVVGNEIITVPKNSKTDRVIAVEPGINLWFQKSIGNMIRSRLRRAGIDLQSQHRNQQLARLGSISSKLATIDFSSASDSISLELVRELIPPRWYTLLSACRSSVGTHNGSIVTWNKFSSMGNGFTFELESLIFYAAASACAEATSSEGEISVYGDDVIIPVSACELFSSFCAFLGFRVNTKKSFSSTYFRESCGEHFFDGLSCKPIFLKEKVKNVQAIFKLANSVRLLAHRHMSHMSCDARFLPCWRHLYLRTPKSLRLRIPCYLGDGGFISNFDEATPITARDGIEGYYYRAIADIGVNRSFDGLATFVARLWRQSQQEYGNNYTLRGRVRTRVIRALTPQWYNLGAWI